MPDAFHQPVLSISHLLQQQTALTCTCIHVSTLRPDRKVQFIHLRFQCTVVQRREISGCMMERKDHALAVFEFQASVSAAACVCDWWLYIRAKTTRNSPGDEIPNVASLYFATLAFNAPDRGFPWDDLRKRRSKMAKVRNCETILPKVSTPWVGRRNVI